jgi:hypothetical protein
MRELRCSHRNTGRQRVTAAPKTTHRINVRCEARMAAASIEYLLGSIRAATLTAKQLRQRAEVEIIICR